MNSNLLNNIPKTTTKEEFEKAWNNSAYIFEPLWKTLDQFITENTKTKKDDFDCPNHYAKLAYQAGLTQAYQHIISMLPQSAKPI